MTTNSNYLWLLDPGHGGTKNGRYVTNPHKRHVFDDGFTINEGEVNREITLVLERCLAMDEIAYKTIPSWQDDTPLASRVALADKLFETNRNAIYLSIHSNWSNPCGKGNEIYTSIGQTKSDKVAQIFCEVYQKYFPD